MKNVSWDSQIYAISYGKILLLLLSLSFLFVNSVDALIRAALPFLIIIIFEVIGEKGRTALQKLLYTKRNANYQISQDGLIVKYGKRKRFIRYKNIESFSDISPFSVTEHIGVLSPGVNYAQSSKFAICYLFIKYAFYVEILPIFLPLNMKEEIVNNLSAFIKFAPYRKYQKIS